MRFASSHTMSAWSRFVAAAFSSLAISDFLQIGYKAAEDKGGGLEDLSLAEMQAIQAHYRNEETQARRTEASQVVVSSPAGGTHAGAVAGKVADLLASEGIPPRSIVSATYQGGRTAPVVVSFARHFASSPECGDWSQSITETGHNEPYANFGCAQQHNIAALVADPQDIKVPRVSTPSDAMRRSQVLTDYRKPADTATPSADTVVISDAIAQ